MGAKQQDNPFVADDDLWAAWTKMPKLTRDAALRAADARHEQQMAKARLDVCRAQLAFAIRTDPEKYDIPAGKRLPAVDVVDSTVRIQPEFLKALREFNEAMYAVDVAEADVEAYLTMRKELENKVQLLTLNYYGEREPRPLSGESRDRVERRKRDAGGGVDVE